MLRIEDIINKCIQGGVAQDILDEIQDELPDLNSIRMHLMKDLKHSGVSVKAASIKAEGSTIELNISKVIIEQHRDELNLILDTYSSTYPELEFLLPTGFGVEA